MNLNRSFVTKEKATHESNRSVCFPPECEDITQIYGVPGEENADFMMSLENRYTTAGYRRGWCHSNPSER